MKYKIRNLHEKMPPEGFCGLCGLKNDECACTKYNCKCDILATECKWPSCICMDCTKFDNKCECSNEK